MKCFFKDIMVIFFVEMIPDGSNGDVATDSYNRYKVWYHMLIET